MNRGQTYFALFVYLSDVSVCVSCLLKPHFGMGVTGHYVPFPLLFCLQRGGEGEDNLLSQFLLCSSYPLVPTMISALTKQKQNALFKTNNFTTTLPIIIAPPPFCSGNYLKSEINVTYVTDK